MRAASASELFSCACSAWCASSSSSRWRRASSRSVSASSRATDGLVALALHPGARADRGLAIADGLRVLRKCAIAIEDRHRVCPDDLLVGDLRHRRRAPLARDGLLELVTARLALGGLRPRLAQLRMRRVELALDAPKLVAQRLVDLLDEARDDPGLPQHGRRRIEVAIQRHLDARRDDERHAADVEPALPRKRRDPRAILGDRPRLVLEGRQHPAAVDHEARPYEAHAAHAEPPAAHDQAAVDDLEPVELEARAGTHNPRMQRPAHCAGPYPGHRLVTRRRYPRWER